MILNAGQGARRRDDRRRAAPRAAPAARARIARRADRGASRRRRGRPARKRPTARTVRRVPTGAPRKNVMTRRAWTARSAPLRRVRWIIQRPSTAAPISSTESASIDGCTTRTSRTSARGTSRVLQVRRGRLHVDRRLQLLNQRRFPQQRLDLGADTLPLSVRRARHLRLQRAPAAVREMRAQTPAQVHRLPDVQRAAVRVLQHVDARRRRRVAADPFARAPPDLAPILEHERLRDEPPRELRRGAANAEDLGRQALMIRRVAHLSEPRQQCVAKQLAAPTGWVTRSSSAGRGRGRL